MASATHRPKSPNETSPPETVDVFDLESAICDTYRFAHVASELLGDLLLPTRGEKLGEGGYLRFTFNDDQMQDVLFMANEAQYRAHLLRDQFYAMIEAGRAA